MSNDVDNRRVAIRAYEPKQLNSRHHEILRLNLLGMSNVDIAAQVGCTPATVSTVLNSRLGKTQATMFKECADADAIQVAKRIRELAPRAVALMNEIMEDDSVSSAVRLRAAQDMLDRAGFAPTKQVAVNSTQVHISGQDLELLKETALSRARQNGILIDVTPEGTDEGE